MASSDDAADLDLWCDGKRIVGVDEAVCHARRVERRGRVALAVKQDEAAGGVSAGREPANTGIGDKLCVVRAGRSHRLLPPTDRRLVDFLSRGSALDTGE